MDKTDKTPGRDREAALAQALRANLRRRKALKSPEPKPRNAEPET